MTYDITMPPSILPQPEITRFPVIGADGLPEIRRAHRGLSAAFHRRSARRARTDLDM
jgi:hypothetical protein